MWSRSDFETANLLRRGNTTRCAGIETRDPAKGPPAQPEVDDALWFVILTVAGEAGNNGDRLERMPMVAKRVFSSARLTN